MANQRHEPVKNHRHPIRRSQRYLDHVSVRLDHFHETSWPFQEYRWRVREPEDHKHDWQHSRCLEIIPVLASIFKAFAHLKHGLLLWTNIRDSSPSIIGESNNQTSVINGCLCSEAFNLNPYTTYSLRLIYSSKIYLLPRRMLVKAAHVFLFLQCV